VGWLIPSPCHAEELGMSGSKTFALAAGVWALASNVAFAADMPLLERAPVIEEFGGWYLRGDIGITNQQLGSLYNRVIDSTPQFAWIDTGSFESSWLVGLGVGYQFNGWLRTDLTGEYRGKSSFYARDRWFDAGTATWMGNEHRGDKSEWLFLANAYIDLGTWYGITPFVGAGLGVVGISIDNFTDLNVADPNGGGYGPSHTNWNFAWALHAGLAYHLTPNATLELAYRYLSLGDAETGDLLSWNGANNVADNPTIFKDITSHDVKVALRWQLGGSDAPPVVRKY
jgi:opacity protein-like surface antigen